MKETSSGSGVRRTIRSEAAWMAGLLLLGWSGSAWSLEVYTMPGFDRNESQGNAQVGQPLAIWGAVRGGTPPYTCVLQFGDGAATTTTVNVADEPYVGENHTYAVAGVKTVRLTVTDSASASAYAECQVRVFAAVTKLIRINMAVEKGLLYLYRNQNASGYWHHSSGGQYQVGQTAFALMAFEEKGHLSASLQDVYARTVQRGVQWLLSQGVMQSISNHDDGTGTVRVSDSNGNGYGVRFHSEIYADGPAIMAIVGSCRSQLEAMSSTVTAGALAGRTYYDVIVDACDQLAWSQCDGSWRGGWSYPCSSQNAARYDGSVMQWAMFALHAAEAVWGVNIPQWVKDNTHFGFLYLRYASGGYGYSAPSTYVNIAKTGGALSTFSWLNLTSASDPNVLSAVAYTATYYLNSGQSYSAFNGGWARSQYAMYSMKKGLELIDGGANTTLATPAGVRNWYDDMAAFLLGDAADLPAGLQYNPALGSGFGQYPDGHWMSDAELYGGSSFLYLVTAWSLLVLERGVVVPPPVAQIAPVSEQPPATPFETDGSASFHMNPARTLVQWLWDWDASDGIDWDAPDASGPRPVNPGYPTNGTYVVTLRVADDGNPVLYDTETVQVTVNTSNHPPVAVAIPAAQLPSYAGRVGVPITLDGRESFDPDAGDTIVTYEWDLDGDGQYDDAFTPVTTVTFGIAGQGQIGLRVTDNHGAPSVNTTYIDIGASANDLRVASFLAQRVLLDPTQAVVHLAAVVRNDPASDQGQPNVLVRFYDGNPFQTGNMIGSNFWVNLPVGAAATISVANVSLPVGAQTVYAFVDANEAIAEWDETNNLAKNEVGLNKAFGDVTAETGARFDWKLDLQKGTLIGTLRLANSGTRILTEPFRYLVDVRWKPDLYIVHPDGTVSEGGHTYNYEDITSETLAALAKVGNQDSALDPGESVTVRNCIEMYQRVRSAEPGYMKAGQVWADPPHPMDGVDGSRANFVIDDAEVLTAVDLWIRGQIDDFALLDAIRLWKAVWYAFDESIGRWIGH